MSLAGGLRPIAKQKVAAGSIALVLLGGLLSSCFWSSPGGESYQGWVEGQFVFVGPDETGRIEKLSVREGDRIGKGDHLFNLDEALQVDNLAEAEAALVNAQVAFNRAQDLLKKKVGTEKAFDDAKAALQAAKAHRDSAKTRRKRRQVFSPVAGSVQEVYFRLGEMVQAARPVVSILPPRDVRVRFFVPQAALSGLKIGSPVSVTCDGCAKPASAKISFVSSKAEYTPPVIYSTEERSRLVFRVEAQPDDPHSLEVGQPVTIAVSSKDKGA